MTVVGTGPASIADKRRENDELEVRALVERAQDDPDAFAALFRRYVSAVHGFAYRRSGSREVAEEVTSATFERVWRALPAFTWQGGGFEPWLFKIAATEIAAYYRRQRRSTGPRSELAHQTLLPAGGATTDDPDLERLRAALSTLHVRYQEAISLRYLEGLSHEEAAAAMGCTKAVMAVTLHRATVALRRAMTKEGTR